MLVASASSLNIVVGAEEPIVPKPKKAKKAEWEFNKMFQDIWVAKLPWVETVIGLNGKLSMVKCKVCNYVDKRNQLLVPKFDGL